MMVGLILERSPLTPDSLTLRVRVTRMTEVLTFLQPSGKGSKGRWGLILPVSEIEDKVSNREKREDTYQIVH